MLTQLGYKDTDRLLIINADDFGMCHSANAATAALLQEGVISSATLMIPCPWALEGAKIAVENPTFDIGIHLTLTSEWKNYKWGPVTRNADVSTLITEQGYFQHKCRDVEERASSEQVYLELRNQILLAKQMGVDPTHLDNHMGSIYGLDTGIDFLREVIDLCVEFQLPLRLPRNRRSSQINTSPAIIDMLTSRVRYAEQRGVVLIDHLEGLKYSLQEGETYADFKEKMIELLRNLQVGVSEVIIHPFFATEELKNITTQWEKRQMEYEIFRDDEVKQVIHEENISLINWRMLRDLQRK